MLFMLQALRAADIDDIKVRHSRGKGDLEVLDRLGDDHSGAKACE